MKRILLLRSSPNEESDEYHKKIKEHEIGLEPTSIPVLDFGFCNIEQLCDAIQSTNSYSGIVFSSPRAVEAFTKSVNSADQGKEIISYLNDNHFLIFVVGIATGKAVKKLGLQPLGDQAGNAENLGKFIVERKDKITKPLLFPCGNLAKDTLPMIFSSSNIPFTKLVVYRTEPHSLFREAFKKLLDKYGDPHGIVFFSPSGAEFFLTYIQQLVQQFDKIKIIAIGSTTKTGLEQMDCMVHGMALKPTPEKLTETLEHVFSH